MGGKDNQSIWVLYWYCSTNITIWLFNIAMENHRKSPFLIGKPSISMGHLYHGYVSHNQRVISMISTRSQLTLPLLTWGRFLGEEQHLLPSPQQHSLYQDPSNTTPKDSQMYLSYEVNICFLWALRLGIP